MQAHSDAASFNPYKQPNPRIMLQAATPMTLANEGCGVTRVTLKEPQEFELVDCFSRIMDPILVVVNSKGIEFEVPCEFMPWKMR